MNEDIKAALNSQKVQKAISELDADKRKRLESILGNEAELKRIINTPQAQQLIKKLTERSDG